MVMTPATMDSGSTLTLHHSALEQQLSGDSVTTTTTGDDTLQARLRVYRKNGVNSYQKVVDNDNRSREYEESDVMSLLVCDSNSYCCETLSIISAQIEKNDIIGVCMRDTGGHGTPCKF